MIKNYYSFLLFGFMAVATSLQAWDPGNKPETKEEEEKEEAFENGFEKAMQAKKKISTTRKVFSTILGVILGLGISLLIPLILYLPSLWLTGVISAAILRQDHKEDIKRYKQYIQERGGSDKYYEDQLAEAEAELKKSSWDYSKEFHTTVKDFGKSLFSRT